MIIGVISDTHDHLTMIDRAIELFNERSVHAVIHAGDLIAPFAATRLLGYRGPIYVIYGNNDGEREGLRAVLPQIKDGPLKLAMGGRRIVVHHFIEWCSHEDLAEADVVITGHTHEVINTCDDGHILLNPGECCGWVTQRPTVAFLDTAALTAEIVDL